MSEQKKDGGPADPCWKCGFVSVWESEDDCYRGCCGGLVVRPHDCFAELVKRVAKLEAMLSTRSKGQTE